jgi:hypothetical protein
MTAQDVRFLTALRDTFGETGFNSVSLAQRIPRVDLPEHVQKGSGDPARMFGRWLANRVGWTYRGLTLQKLSRRDNTQYWRFGTLPADEPATRVMTLEPSGRWYWQDIGLWPDEVVK